MVLDRVLTEVVTSFSDTVAGDFAVEDVLQRLAQSAVHVLGAAGAGVMVPSDGELLRFSFASGPSMRTVTALGELQEHLQDGPCKDSYDTRQAINIADLAVEGDWPLFQAHAVRAGLRAVAAVPLLARGERWGVLDLYRAEPRRLDAGELAAVQTLAQVATSYLVVTADRDAAREAQQQLAFRAMHDPLTGLPVRWVFLEQLEHAVAGLARRPGHVGVLFADVDGLKYVNDTFGHDAGDRLLVTCVQRIRAAVRPTDVVARLGGDEFVVLLEDLGGAEDASTVARRVIAELAHPYQLDGEVVQPSASLGLALTDDPVTQPAALIAHADNAMYRAKRAGRGRYALFDSAGYTADRVESITRRSTATALREALHSRQLRLHYQPIFDLSEDGMRVHALEALVRWQHPDRGLLAAEEFVPGAERAGLMPELGSWVLEEACEQLLAWDAALGDRAPSRLFVNVSADELGEADFARHLGAVLERTGLAASRLTLEVTETWLISDGPTTGRSLSAVRALGCELAVDDFGTGYSSLSRLVDLPASTWKIDRSFTGGLTDRPASSAVVSAVLQLGRELDRAVVVEGVEDAETLQRLRRLGCTHAQGYHLGRPAPPREVAAHF